MFFQNLLIFNVCEIKFATTPFTITKSYADNLNNKITVFKQETKTNKTLFLTMIAAHGLVNNAYSQQLVKDVLDMNALFES